MERLIPWFLHARTGRLISVFLLFVLVQALFATFYFLLYRQKRANFAFNADILRSQSVSARIASEGSLTLLKKAIEVLEEATRELGRGAEPVVNGRLNAALDLPSGRKCVMRFLSGPPAGGPGGSRLVVVDSNGEILLDADPTEFSVRGWLNSAAWLTTPADWQAVIPRVLKNAESEARAAVRRLDSLSTEQPDVWTYWDFFYFSTIVQTTVGFGDILPNSTLTRMLVASQILAGYALLIVVLNAVLGS